MSFDMAFPIAKKSPFKDIFNHALRKIMENGELQRIKEKYKFKEPDCTGKKGRSLGIYSLSFVFVVFAVGPVLAGVLLVAEIIKKMI